MHFFLLGESTRPGAKNVEAQEELERVLPVLESLGKRKEASDLIISLDTNKVQNTQSSIINNFDIFFYISNRLILLNKGSKMV